MKLARETNCDSNLSGDQGFVENCTGAIYSRTSETNPAERLTPFIPLPQEFHAEKVAFRNICQNMGSQQN